ncbi:ASCH domain-containing protein [Paenibacillus sp. Cedars]|uniref:ASCH domain-containing protein n=1 Tax=Paenibacillus sp. Cedars TaxID=1980674 RepID=UPI001164E8F3|nr:ASCH domain-containing protein [Paenibacillus sp. Cedars]AWP28802.1 2-oxoglutarate dehydrogenase E1 [Paenibacillus sp. Cedars]
MKAITIIQPWATLIALGEKQLETRSWPTKHRGELAIHAGKKIDREACEVAEIKAALMRHGYTVESLPTGAVVAIASMTECWSIGMDYQSGMPLLYHAERGREETRIVGLKESKSGFYYPGRFAWEMANVNRLLEPIPAKGMQGFWNWEGMTALGISIV